MSVELKKKGGREKIIRAGAIRSREQRKGRGRIGRGKVADSRAGETD